MAETDEAEPVQVNVGDVDCAVERVPPEPGMFPGRNGGWLKPFPKGQSGNPGGVPRKPYREAHGRFADLKVSTLRRMVPNDLTVAEAEARRMKLASMRGNVRAGIESADRTEGKVPLQLTGADGAALIPPRVSLAEEAARLLAAIAGRAK